MQYDSSALLRTGLLGPRARRAAGRTRLDHQRHKPDGGRGSRALVALSFNNFSAERSVPLLAELGQQFNFRSEFSPSPRETLDQVGRTYRQAHNLLVRFRRDSIDQSAGLRRQMLGEWADDPARQRGMDQLAELISAWA